jgi:hypothetical protein
MRGEEVKISKEWLGYGSEAAAYPIYSLFQQENIIVGIVSAWYPAWKLFLEIYDPFFPKGFIKM